MARIAIVMLPEAGHLLPTFRISRKLIDLGHVVEYLTIPACESFVVSHGFAARNVLPDLTTADSEHEDLFEARKPAIEIYRDISRRLHANQNDFGKELFSELSAAAPHLIIFDTAVCSLLNRAFSREHFEDLGAKMIRLSTAFPEVYQDDPVPEYTRHLPELILCPEEFDIPRSGPAPSNRFYVEPSVFMERQPINFPWERLDRHRRLVYCSLGTQRLAYDEASRLLDKIVRTFCELDTFQLVLVTAGNQHLASVETDYPNIVRVARAPQLQLIECADIVITHGGLGTIKESILAGKPMIVIPFLYDQPLNGSRVEHHRIGLVLPAQCSVIDLCSALTEVSSIDRYRQNVASLQARFSSAESITPSLKHIADLLDASPNNSDL